MALNDCCKCVKFFFVLINLLITIIGLAVLGLALWLYFDTFHYLQIAQANNDYYRGTFLLMGVGILMTVIGFLGCVGACRESPVMLGMFFALVLLIFVAEIAIIVWIHMNTDKLREELRESVAIAVKLEYGQISPRTEALDVIQSQLHCCGGKAPADWAQSRFNTGDQPQTAIERGVTGITSALGMYKVPDSCCNVPPEDPRCKAGQQIQLTGALSGAISQRGCGDALLEFLEEHVSVVIGTVAGVMVVQIMAMIIALSLCITVMRTERRYKA